MQKVLRRTKLAKGQAARKAKQNKKVNDASLYRYSKRQQKPINEEIRRAVRGARKAQREDWTLGALAPKRDIGEQADKYGTVSIRRIQPPVEKADGWWKDYCIVEGDRVVIVEPGHRDRGKIGTVKEVKMKAEHCTVEGLNEVDVAIPEYMLINEQDKSPHRTVEASLPLSSVNLVYPLPNATTGELHDVIIRQLRRGKVRDEKNPPERFIADYEPEYSIPYPEVEPEEYRDHDSDTFRIEVEKKTWVPTLIRPPMPPSIIDELRNKYSKFRDRHDEDFVRKKTEETKAAGKRRRELKQLMMSPLKELHQREREQKKARGKQKLSMDALSILGQHVAKYKGLSSVEEIEAAAGLISSTPSRAVSSAIRSTFAASSSPASALNSKTIHSSSRASSQAMHKILKRNMSNMTLGTSSPNLAVTTALSLEDAGRAAPNGLAATLSNELFSQLAASRPVTEEVCKKPMLEIRKVAFTPKVRTPLSEGLIHQHDPPLLNLKKIENDLCIRKCEIDRHLIRYDGPTDVRISNANSPVRFLRKYPGKSLAERHRATDVKGATRLESSNDHVLSRQPFNRVPIQAPIQAPVKAPLQQEEETIAKPENVVSSGKIDVRNLSPKSPSVNGL